MGGPCLCPVRRKRMSGQDQCALCLSCGAPFLPSSNNVHLLGRRANLSVLYIEDKCKTNRTLLDLYDNPGFASDRQQAHMIHGSHHEAALDYMCHHHTTDEGAATPAAGRPIAAPNGPFPYYKSASKNSEPCVASWAQPPDDDRVNLAPLWDHIVGKGPCSISRPRDASFVADLGRTYPMCRDCNALMTQLSYVRYIVGFTSTADKNANGCILADDFQGISVYKAKRNRAGLNLSQAFGRWSVDAASFAAPILYPSRTGTEDPVAPHIAYYLHLCQPFQTVPGTDPFTAEAGLAGSVEAARVTFFQQAWTLLVIVCIATMIERGKNYGSHKLSHGLHQMYGVLDVYVSYFIWWLCWYDYAPQLLRTGVTFPQWHQKYFWFATDLPGLGARDFAVVGLASYN